MSKLHYFKGFHALLMLLCSLFSLSNLTAQTAYCASKGNKPWNEWIAGVQIGTINNPSIKEGYGNFTNLSTPLVKGTSYPLHITQGFSWAADPATATQQGRVWIDFNQNGNFEASELVASLTRNAMNANVLIPTTALTGTTRMRVSLKTIGEPTACDVFEKGEVEDYTVNIQNGSTGGNLPDLILANSTIPNPSVQQGQILNWKVDIKNIGAGNATSNFSVKAYLSTDNVWSANDIQAGIIPTANFAAGFSALQVPGTSTVSTSVPAGQYYLILKVDAENQIPESNENNNILVSTSTFTVTNACTTCGFMKTYGPHPIVDYWSQATVNNNALIWKLTDPVVREGLNRVVTLTTDLNGVQTNLTDVIVSLDPPYKVTATVTATHQIQIQKTLTNGTVEWTKTYPFKGAKADVLQIIGSYVYEVTDGFIIHGAVAYGTTTNGGFSYWTMKVLPNGDFVAQNNWGNFAVARFLTPLFKSVSGGYFATFFKENLFELVKFDNNGAFLWSAPLTSNLRPTPTYLRRLRESADGTSVFAVISNNRRAELRKYNAIIGGTVWTKSLGTVLSPNEPFTVDELVSDAIPTNDGGAVVGYPFRTPITGLSGYEYGRLDANGKQVWYKRLNNQYDLEPKAAIGNCGFLFVGRKNANLMMMRITNDGEIVPNCSGDTIPTQLPDLKISDLQIQSSVLANNVLVPFKFDISNLGNANATNPYKIRFWLSGSSALSSDSQLVGTMNGLAVHAGQVLRQVAGSFTVANSEFLYNKNLIIEIDADNQIQESNEDNNFHSLGVKFNIDTTKECRLTATVTNVVCDDKGTATTTDDVVSFTLNTAGETAGGSYYLSYVTELYTGVIGTPLRVTNFSFPGDFAAFGVNRRDKFSCGPIVGMDKAKVCNAVAAPMARMQMETVVPQLSPNPADKEVTIALESLDNEIVQFDFSSTAGSLVFSEKRKVDKGVNRLLFEVAQLPKGIYWVTPTTNQGRIAPMKFVKL
ncbi:MAG: hypothetical protein RLZZ628_806 [Bacteroidota bacterium]|jgi:hypothetical protein